MWIERRFEEGRAKHLLVLSLIGHYERIAGYLFSMQGLRGISNVQSMQPLRVRPRGALSLLKAAGVMARHLLVHRGAMVGIPRSNSRAIRLLVGLFPSATYFSYSDGLGDSIHRFFLAGHPRYAGHVGFSTLGDLPLIHEIPLTECIEPWGRHVVHDPLGPVLIIAKTPKETAFDARHLARLYRRMVCVAGRQRPVLLSGRLDGMDVPADADVQSVGSLMSLSEPLRISAAVGLPSTAFLTLVTRLPASSLHIMRLGCQRTHPDADRRIASMRITLQRCIRLLQPASTAGDGAERRPAEKAQH